MIVHSRGPPSLVSGARSSRYVPSAAVVVLSPQEEPTNTSGSGSPLSASVTVPRTVPNPPGGRPKSTMMSASQKPVTSARAVSKPGLDAVIAMVRGWLSVSTRMSVIS